MIYRYAVTNDPDDWGDAPTFETITDARAYAAKHSMCIVELAYEFSDSEVLDGADDFRPVSTRRAEDIDALDRDQLVALLEGAGIKCYDHEDDETLREAVRVNLDDGTIDEADL